MKRLYVTTELLRSFKIFIIKHKKLQNNTIILTHINSMWIYTTYIDISNKLIEPIKHTVVIRSIVIKFYEIIQQIFTVQIKGRENISVHRYEILKMFLPCASLIILYNNKNCLKYFIHLIYTISLINIIKL